MNTPCRRYTGAAIETLEVTMSRRRGHSAGKNWAGIPALLLLTASATFAQQVSYPAFQIGGFADAIVSHSTGSGANDLDFGELDPYATVQISDSWSALVEAIGQRIERGKTADAPRSRRFDLDLERLFAAYAPADSFRLELGEVNSGLLAWNQREERPRFLQTPIDMPAIAQDQERKGAWPLHLFGAWISGRLAGSAGFSYGFGAGRSRASTLDDSPSLSGPGSAGGLISFSFAPDAVEGWEVGAAGYAGSIPAPEGTYHEIDATLSTSYVSGPLELRVEWSRMNHELLGRTHVSQGWYALLSTRLPGKLVPLRPYFLLDHLDVAADEPYLDDVHNQRAWAAGVRYDANRHLALKLEYRSQRAASPDHDRLIRLELAVAY